MDVLTPQPYPAASAAEEVLQALVTGDRRLVAAAIVMTYRDEHGDSVVKHVARFQPDEPDVFDATRRLIIALNHAGQTHNDNLIKSVAAMASQLQLQLQQVEITSDVEETQVSEPTTTGPSTP